MDLKSSKLSPPPLFPSHGGVGGVRKENPFVDGFPDPLCNFHLKETSDFVKSFPMAKKDGAVTKRNVIEAPPTPGRPVFGFSFGSNGSRKNFPSKWNDAEKWLVGGHDSPAHQGFVKSADFMSKPSSSSSSSSNGSVIKQQQETHPPQKEVSKPVSSFSLSHRHHNPTRAFNGISPSESSDVLKDKFTHGVEPNFQKFKCLEPMSEGFLFGDSSEKPVGNEVKHRDIGTEMTPLGSSTTSRCPTPFKSLSPPRHNTPASRSGPLALMDPSSSFDIGELQECHLAKLQQGTPFDSVTSNWSSREEEEEDISKSLRHFEMNNECRKSISEPRSCAWEEEERTKYCLRYQREEAKIEAWVNLQKAKAEAQSRKLEVKIQKMRSKLEEKLTRRMTIVHRKAEELRAAAQVEHTEKMHKATEQAKRTTNWHRGMHFGHNDSCGCFPCNSLRS